MSSSALTDATTWSAPGRIVVATHGGFAEGILGALQMICGRQPHVECINAYQEAGVDYDRRFQELVETHDYDAWPLVVVTDLLGGSVNNAFIQLLPGHPFLLVSGLNLPLLMELALSPVRLDEGVVRGIVERSRGFVVYCGDELLSAGDEGEF